MALARRSLANSTNTAISLEGADLSWYGLFIITPAVGPGLGCGDNVVPMGVFIQAISDLCNGGDRRSSFALNTM